MTVTGSTVRIVTESREFALLLPRVFWRAFKMEFDEFPSMAAPGKLVFQITQEEKLEKIFNHLGYDLHQSLVLHVNFGILEDECCRMSFLRGAFLAGGSVTDPEKRYHLELTTSHAQASREMSALLVEMGFQPRHVMRGGNSVTYFKQCEHIEDLLTTMEVVYEFYLRGFEFAPISIYESHATKFLIKDGKILPPFVAISGLGESAAWDLMQGREGKTFLSIEEVSLACPKVSKTHMQMLKDAGAFGSLPDTSQVSFF